MAQRKSATKTEARERARRAAAESMAREQRLLELGEEFFVAQGEAEQITETAEQRIAEIRAKAEQEATQAKEAQASVVVRMKEERVTVSDIAQRLELSAAAVRALLKDSAEVTTPADSELERETVDA
jgi:predicted Rossmann fold nucleotide-binding protein DprA/Smf involved in DNA uptake